MLTESLKKTVADLLKIGPRAPGSWKELEAAEYLKGRLSEMGYDAAIESFNSASHMASEAVLEACARSEKFETLPTQFSPAGDVRGTLVFLGYEKHPAIDIEGDLSGKIGVLMINAASIPERIDYILQLERNGLEGLIVVTPLMDLLNAKIVRYPEVKKLPTVTVSYRSGCELMRREGEEFRLAVMHEGAPRSESVNVVATLPGACRHWIAVSAHMDTAAFAPGAFDNAGGIAMLLQVAEHFANKKLPATVHFVCSGSEEYGLLDCCGAGGEAFYKSREGDLENCVAHIEIDDIGQWLGMLDVDCGGSGRFKKAVKNIETKVRYRLNEQNNPSCDHGAAVKRGIPYIWFSDAHLVRPPYHTPEDKLEALNFDKMAGYFDFIKDSVEALANEAPFYPYVTDGNRMMRPARFEDIPDILEITKSAFGPVCHDKLTEDFFGEKIGGKEWHDYKNPAVKAQVENNIYWVIVCEMYCKVVGYATCSLDFERGIAQIGNNAVHPDFQGRGIGKAMQSEIARRMDEEGFDKFRVSTLSNDVPAQKVYEKLGYKKYIEGIHYLKK